MRVIFIQLIVPILCYFIGVFVGRRISYDSRQTDSDTDS